MWFENENCKEKIKAVMLADDTVVILTENGRVFKLIYDEKETAEEAHNMIERGIIND